MTERVGFGKRFGAQMIDGIVGSIGGMILGAVFGSLLGGAVAAEAGAVSGEAGMTEIAGARFICLRQSRTARAATRATLQWCGVLLSSTAALARACVAWALERP